VFPEEVSFPLKWWKEQEVEFPIIGFPAKQSWPFWVFKSKLKEFSTLLEF
jgi:hypothetical protein